MEKDKSNKNANKQMTIKEVQYLIKHIEQGSLDENEDTRTPLEKNSNIQRLILKLIEEFGELAENIRKDLRYDGTEIKGTIEEEAFDIFYYIIAIANEYGIDMEKIFEIKDEYNRKKYKRNFSLEEARKEYAKKNEK